MHTHSSLPGIPLFKILKKEGRDKGSEPGKAEFARQQRETLENYLIGLIKAVVSRSAGLSG